MYTGDRHHAGTVLLILAVFVLPLSTIVAVGSYHAAALPERARTLIEPGGFACAALSIAAAVYLWFRSVVLASQKAKRKKVSVRADQAASRAHWWRPPFGSGACR